MRTWTVSPGTSSPAELTSAPLPTEARAATKVRLGRDRHPGARADLVLLNENPLADIGAVRSIAAVVVAGVAYERDDLDRLLAGVEGAAGSWSQWPKFIWQLARSPVMRRQFAD